MGWSPRLKASLFVSLFVFGCAKSDGTPAASQPSPSDDAGPGTNPTGGGGDGGTLFGTNEAGATNPDGQCGADTQQIYAMTDTNLLYSFTPSTLTFAPIGVLNCPAGGATATSMGVDRTGIAWVLLTDGGLYRVSVKDASCTATNFVNGQNGFVKFGMGFSSDSSGSASETLYISDHSGKGVAKIDTTTLAVTAIGPYTGDLVGQAAELTGTGDGKLYGFFTTTPARVAEIDKTTGATSNENVLMNTDAGTSWAFAFYGGQFYVFTAEAAAGGLPKDGSGSDVTLYDPVAGTATIVKPKVGFNVVGAGVSTCVPTTPPK